MGPAALVAFLTSLIRTVAVFLHGSAVNVVVNE
jgi:hypothetical protein